MLLLHSISFRGIVEEDYWAGWTTDLAQNVISCHFMFLEFFQQKACVMLITISIYLLLDSVLLFSHV